MTSFASQLLSWAFAMEIIDQVDAFCSIQTWILGTWIKIFLAMRSFESIHTLALIVHRVLVVVRLQVKACASILARLRATSPRFIQFSLTFEFHLMKFQQLGNSIILGIHW